MKKVSEAIFIAKADHRGLKYYNSGEFGDFCVENFGEDIIVSLQTKGNTSQKMRLYAFYHGPLLDCAVIGFTMAGYEGIDKVKADYLLRADFAKDFIKKPNGEYVPVMMDKRRMTKPRLLKFVEDCALFIEITLQQNIPDSESYLASKGTDRKFKKV